MLTSPASGLVTKETQKTAFYFAARGHAAFAKRSLVAANDTAVMRARLEAFVRPVTFAQSRRVA